MTTYSGSGPGDVERRCPVPARSVLSVAVGEATIVWSPWRGRVFTLSETGSSIWKLLDGRHTCRQIVDRLVQQYDLADGAQVEGDVHSFFDQLAARELLVFRDGERAGRGQPGAEVVDRTVGEGREGARGWAGQEQEERGGGEAGDLWLRIGGVTVLLRSGTLPLDRLREPYRHFVVPPGVADLVLDVTVFPWEEEAARRPEGRPDSRVAAVASYFHRLMEGAMGGEELEEFVDVRRGYAERLLPVPGFAEALARLEAGSAERPVDLLCFQRPFMPGGALFLSEGSGCWFGRAFVPAEDSPEATLKVFSYYLLRAAGRVLQRRGALLLHAAAVLRDGAVSLFVGRGGSGKTTVARMSRAHTLLADDGIIVEVGERRGEFVASGTPWNLLDPAWPGVWAQSGGQGTVGRIFFLRHDDALDFVRLDPVDGAARLISQILSPLGLYDREQGSWNRTLQRCVDLCRSLPCYEMRFCPDSDIWAGIDRLGGDRGSQLRV